MNLAFYYHIPIYKSNKGLAIPSYLGVFIDSLAINVDELYLIMHEEKTNIKQADYILKSKNIKWINLGYKTPSWHRAIFHKKILSKKLKNIYNCNILLVRSPSPLAPYFNKYFKDVKLVYMIVGDYSEGIKNMKTKNLRQKLIKLFLYYNIFLFEKSIQNINLVVNSTMLFQKYKSFTNSIHQIRTTTLSASDFFYKEDTCLSKKINLVYSGRIDPQKGLFELIEATALLNNSGYEVVCNLVGWEEDTSEPVKKSLMAFSRLKEIENNIIFHGRKKVGSELNTIYRIGDIYVIPSYHEGFPRTIWEAMANSLPVVASNVGAIPDFLTHDKNVIIINPKSANEIFEAIKRVINDNEFRENMIKEGRALAKKNTLEFQTKKLINILENVAHN